MPKCLFTINEIQMDKINETFESILSNLESKYLWVPFEGQEPVERLKNFFFVCAICHNMNWEFLCNVVIPKLEAETRGFNLDKLRNIKLENLKDFFKGYAKPHKVEAGRRLEMLVTLAGELKKQDDIFFEELIKSKSLKGEDGFLVKVDRFSVFNEDPLRKKSNLLAQLAITSGLINVSDENELSLPIDYHIMRVYLRTGRISINNENVRKRLLDKDEFLLDEITELRQIKCWLNRKAIMDFIKRRGKGSGDR